MMELNKKIETLHKKEIKKNIQKRFSASWQLNAQEMMCGTKEITHMKKEKRDLPKEKMDNSQRTIMKNVVVAIKQEKWLR